MVDLSTPWHRRCAGGSCRTTTTTNDMRRLAIGLSVLLVSCGGGGSGGGSPPPSPPPPPPVNQSPMSTSLSFTAAEDQDYVGAMTATDPEGAAITFARTGVPSHGQVMSFTA